MSKLKVVVNESVTNVDIVNDVTAVSITETFTTLSESVTGIQGPTGATGTTGPANTLDIGTVTSNTTPNATITGTSPNQHLNLVLAKGDTGSTGQGYSQKGIYSASITYVPFDVVYFNGKSYVNISTSTGITPQNTTYWQIFAMGTSTPIAYNASDTYSPGDLVNRLGSTYYCIATTTGAAPPNATYWVLFASKGDTGSAGPTGPAGPVAPIVLNSITGDDTFSRSNTINGSVGQVSTILRFSTFQATKSYVANNFSFLQTNTSNFNTGTVQYVLWSYDGDSYFVPKGTVTTNLASQGNASGVKTFAFTALSGADLNIVAGNYYAISINFTSGFTTAPIYAGLPAGSSSLINLKPLISPISASGFSPVTSITDTFTWNVAQIGSTNQIIWFRVYP